MAQNLKQSEADIERASTAIDFEDGFDQYIKANQKTWQHDRMQSVGASEVFGCLRKAWFTKHDIEKDFDHEERWGAMERGNLIENHFVAPAMTWFMKKLGGKTRLVWAGKAQKTLIEGRLSATPDGLVINAPDDALARYGVASLGGTGCFNLEIKSIDPRVNLKEEKTVHRGQVNVQMGLTRDKTPYKPNYAVIIYIDASFLDDIDIFIVPFDANAFRIAQLRSKSVYDIEDPAKIPPEGKIDGVCEYCPFKRVCAQTTGAATPTEGEASNKQKTPLAILEVFEGLVRSERAAHSEKKVVEQNHKEASEKLKEWFRETGVRRASANDESIKASIAWVKGRKSPDLNAMRADGIDVDKYLVAGEGHDRLTISERGSTRADAD